jgi:hypothetical protein
MTPSEFEAALQAAFNRCDAASCPLNEQQKQILQQAVEKLTRKQPESLDNSPSGSELTNPLDELTPKQLQSFLEFVKEQEQQNRPWKIQLMNDWLQERNSGAVQFIRDRFGLSWLNRIKPVHFTKYVEIEVEEPLKLKVGDRIEVSNALWEWVQQDGPCSREWVLCTVIQVRETSNGEGASINCIIRFSTGAEYEIQGMYQWNRYNWRWPEE